MVVVDDALLCAASWKCAAVRRGGAMTHVCGKLAVLCGRSNAGKIDTGAMRMRAMIAHVPCCSVIMHVKLIYTAT